MTTVALAAGLCAAAVLLLPPRQARFRLRRILPPTAPTDSALLRRVRSLRVWPLLLGFLVGVLVMSMTGSPHGFVAAIALGTLTGGVARWLAVRVGSDEDEPLRLALTCDLLAVCLRAGLPVPHAVRAAASVAPPKAARALCATADLLALGSDVAEAWEPVGQHRATAELARAARRTARSGTALADSVAVLAKKVRSTVHDEAETRAQRAAVLIAGPLGLCFLPAFLCLGVVPVIIGIADQLSVPF